MTEHVDCNLLGSDLRYRFEYLSKFLNFTSDDIESLNALAPVIFPRVPVIVDTVYRKLFSFDITKHYFVVRNQEFEKFSQCRGLTLTLDSAQMTFRKEMLSVYLKRVLTQSDWNDTFLQYLSYIGKIHTNQAGSTSINVDYMHINALLGYLENLIIEIILNTDCLDDLKKRTMILAVNKLFWLQNDFFTMHFLTSDKYNTSSSLDKKLSNPACCCLLN